MHCRSLVAAVRVRRVLFAAALLLAGAGRAGATVITAFPVNFAAAEQSAFHDAVATFEDDNPAATPADFTATIDWGDGSPTTAGTIGMSSGAFVVIGQHTYGDEGAFTATVTISDVPPGTGTATATDAATVDEADVLSGSPASFSVPTGVSFTQTVATFSDTLSAAASGDFTATIDWGDATTSAGTVSGGGGSFQVSGTHTYAAAGNFSVQATLSDDAPGTATATVTSAAHVASGLATSAVSFSIPEGVTFNGTVATFSEADTSRLPGSFSTSIFWGDGTTTAGTVSGGSGSFAVSGQHTYADEGAFPMTVTVFEVGGLGASSSSLGTVTVTEADVLSGTPVAISPFQGAPFTGVVATFTDADTANVASDLVATIDWGDGHTSPGTVSGGGGSFAVSGSHTYAASGSFTVTVTLADDPPGTAMATVASAANVMAGIAAIPTLGPHGLLLLALALAGAALYSLRRLGAG
jgi:IPTL-CTERM motif